MDSWSRGITATAVPAAAAAAAATASPARVATATAAAASTAAKPAETRVAAGAVAAAAAGQLSAEGSGGGGPPPVGLQAGGPEREATAEPTGLEPIKGFIPRDKRGIVFERAAGAPQINPGGIRQRRAQ